MTMEDRALRDEWRHIAGVLTSFLPAADRERYQEELAGEMYELRNSPLSVQLRYSVGMSWFIFRRMLGQRNAPTRLPRTIRLFACLTGDAERYTCEYAAEWHDMQSEPRRTRLAYLARIAMRAGMTGINSLRTRLSRT
ncbi:hypothetical protein [Streptomyces sp. NBC_01353]|uniref:hypothetical protein n=1 Tax=Streptomyces sp. NBC_01353 TaxID=2903835 RepID=UPI002E369B85|nr:hypothetical protein [Streptomyces sp. NBC_01353]